MSTPSASSSARTGIALHCTKLITCDTHAFLSANVSVLAVGEDDIADTIVHLKLVL